MFSVLWMLLSTISFTLMAFIIKLQTKNYAIPDILFIRSAASMVFVLLLQYFLHFPLRTQVPGIHVRRSLFGFVSMSAWYYTLGVLPMGVSVTLNYLSPLFLGVFVYLFDKTSNKPTLVEVGFIVLGFFGVMVLLDPIGGAMRTSDLFPVLLGVAAAIVAALAFKDVRILKNNGQNEWQMVFYFSTMTVLLSLPFTSLVRFDFNSDLQGALLLTLAGVLGALGQWGVSKAFGSGDQIVAASLQYMSVIFSLLLSWLVLSETVSSAQFFGIVIIVISAVLNIVVRGRRFSSSKP